MQTGARFLAKDREVIDNNLFKKLAVEAWMTSQGKCLEAMSKMKYHEVKKLCDLFKISQNKVTNRLCHPIDSIENQFRNIQHGVGK